MSTTYGREDLLSHLEDLADDLGRTPTSSDVREHDGPSITPYYSHFDGFEDALEQAGLEKDEPDRGIPREQLLEELQSYAAEIGETPTRTQMNDGGPRSSMPYYREFGSWNDALRAAGLEPNHEYVSDEQLLQALRDAADELGRDPTFKEIKSLTGHSGSTFARRFGSWLEAREVAGLSGEIHRYGRRADRDGLLEDLRRLGELFGRAPTQKEIVVFGKYSHMTYYRHFETFRNALGEAGFALDETSREWPDDYPDDWLDRAEQVRERDGYQCIRCSKTNEQHLEEYNQQLHVHHVHTEDGDPDALENLVTLCAACHKKWDRVEADPRD